MKKLGTPPRGENGSDSENGLPPPTELPSPSAGVVAVDEVLVEELDDELLELELVVRLDGRSERELPGRAVVVVLELVELVEEVVVVLDDEEEEVLVWVLVPGVRIVPGCVVRRRVGDPEVVVEVVVEPVVPGGGGGAGAVVVVDVPSVLVGALVVVVDVDEVVVELVESGTQELTRCRTPRSIAPGGTAPEAMRACSSPAWLVSLVSTAG